MTWDPRSEKNIVGVHPDLIQVMAITKQKVEAKFPGLTFVLIEGVRTKARQRELYAAGATTVMNSRHLTGHAVDFAPVLNGKMSFDWPLYHRVAPCLKEASAELGIPVTWGGDWVSFQDGPHVELPKDRYPA